MIDRNAPAWLLALALALAPTAVFAQDAPPEGGSAPAAPVAEEDAHEETDEYLQDLTAEMMKKVEEVRGLKFKAPVERVWKSRDEARDEMIDGINEEYPPEEIDKFSRVLAFNGLIPEGANIRDVFAEFISAGAGGYYMPDKDIFSLVRGFDPDANGPIVFHELVHAVEDQYYDYDARTRRYGDENADDHAMALKAVVEGSARYYENMYVDGVEGLRLKYFQAQMRASQDQGDAAGKIPPSIIVTMVMYPYSNGDEFIQVVLPTLLEEDPLEEGEDPMARLFNDPPVSTEMVLHPEKYLGTRDLPQTVSLPDVGAALGEGWVKEIENTNGELNIGVLINRWFVPNNIMMQAQAALRMPTSQPTNQEEFARMVSHQVVEFKGETGRATTGWDGDRYCTWYHAGDDVVCQVWASTWDSETDAAEFAATWGKVIGKKYPDAEAVEGATRWNGTGGAGYASAITTSGRMVLIAERVPAASLDAVMDTLAGATATQAENDAVPAR